MYYADYLVPKTWIRVTDQKILSLFEKIIQTIEEKGVNKYCEQKTPECCGIYTTKKQSVKTLGMCKYFSGGRNYIILLSPYVLAGSQKELENTLIHEIAHGYNPHNHHGRDWAWFANYIASLFNCGPISRLANASSELGKAIIELKRERQQKTNKYAIECPICKRTWYYKRKVDAVKFPFIYKCVPCNTPLVRAEYKDIINKIIYGGKI